MRSCDSISPVMPQGTAASASSSLAIRFAAFVTERHPFAARIAAEAFEAGVDGLLLDLRRRAAALAPREASETTPGVTATTRFDTAVEELIQDCEGFLRRDALRASLTPEERREMLRGMILTRATDNRLKAFFAGGEVRYRDGAFQGKG